MGMAGKSASMGGSDAWRRHCDPWQVSPEAHRGGGGRDPQ